MYRPSCGRSTRPHSILLSDMPGAPAALDRGIRTLQGWLAEGSGRSWNGGFMKWPGRRTTVGVLAVAALGASPAAAQARSAWSSAGRPAVVHAAHAAEVRASRFKAFKLDASALGARLSTAPEIGLRARALAQGSGTVVSVPAPDGTLQRFELQESPVMEAGLAARHPDIKTYAGRGLDDPAATIRADQTPLGFHASVRSAAGAWYVDPYYHLDDSVYVSYFGRDLADPHG